LLLSLPRASSLPRLPETCARASVFVSHRTLPSVAVQSVRNGPIREETPSSSTQIDSTAAFDPTRTPSALALVILLMTAGAATAAVDGTAAADVSATATAALPIDNLSTLLAALPIEVVDGATDGDPPGDSLSGLFGPALATLFLGSGLVPSLKLANSQAFARLSSQTAVLSEATPASEVGGTVLGISRLLGCVYRRRQSSALSLSRHRRPRDAPRCLSLAPSSLALIADPKPLYTDDVLDVVSRLSAGESLGLQPGRLLRRDEFEAALAGSPSRAAALVGLDGSPLGSKDAQQGASTGPAATSRTTSTSASPRPPPALAVDAAWTALSGGSPYVAPEELERQLSRWRPSPSVFVLEQFERSLLQGRAAIGAAYFILFGLQALTLTVFVLQPLGTALSGF